MDSEPRMTVAFAVLAEWAIGEGAAQITAKPGVWTGETDEWCVTCNPHRVEMDDVPPVTFQLIHKTALVGIALISPFCGHVAGPTEAELIAHFRDRTRSKTHGAADV